jgi:serine O-acetyltransferase
MKMWDSWQLMIQAIQTDIDRYVFIGNSTWWRVLLTKRGLWATIQYRFSRWVHYDFPIPLLRLILKTFCAIWRLLIEMITGIELPNRAKIGKGLYIPHAHGIILNAEARIGEYCNLSQQVTIGYGGRGNKTGNPQLGDRVFVGPGAKILGPITIGNDVAIGANAVVNKDLPDRAVAVGIPAKIISDKGSEDFILYRQSSGDSSLGVSTEVKV